MSRRLLVLSALVLAACSGKGGTGDTDVSDTDDTDAAENVCPTADAGDDASVTVLSTVPLDGTGSADGNGDDLTASWTLLAKPPGSIASISNPTALTASLYVDVPGAYTVQLVVGDGDCESAPDLLLISATAP